jgi:hypothetical protein
LPVELSGVMPVRAETLARLLVDGKCLHGGWRVYPVGHR